MRRLVVARLAAAATLILVLMAMGCTSPARCQQCGRAECRNMTFTIRLADGGKVETCCPRCGLHYIASEHPEVAALAVRDFDSASELDARSAYYVEGSEIKPCSAMETADGPHDERGCCLKQVYDRCLPSLIAFQSEPRADGFAREHGGAVRTFSELERSVR